MRIREGGPCATTSPLSVTRLACFPDLGGKLAAIPSRDGGFALDNLHMERVTGIEPALSAWEADVLPLNYTRVRIQQVRSLASATGEAAAQGVEILHDGPCLRPSSELLGE